jgi:hypothetical protein
MQPTGSRARCEITSPHHRSSEPCVIPCLIEHAFRAANLLPRPIVRLEQLDQLLYDILRVRYSCLQKGELVSDTSRAERAVEVYEAEKVSSMFGMIAG